MSCLGRRDRSGKQLWRKAEGWQNDRSSSLSEQPVAGEKRTTEIQQHWWSASVPASRCFRPQDIRTFPTCWGSSRTCCSEVTPQAEDGSFLLCITHASTLSLLPRSICGSTRMILRIAVLYFSDSWQLLQLWWRKGDLCYHCFLHCCRSSLYFRAHGCSQAC